MDICPNCGANVEGLVYHCDCCGAPLKTVAEMFVYHAMTVAAAGDVTNYLKPIVHRLNKSGLESTFAPIHPIILEVFCYPQHMLQELHIRKKVYLSRKKNKAILTEVIPYDAFTEASQHQKEALVRDAVSHGLSCLLKRIGKDSAEEASAWMDRVIYEK